MCFLYILFCEGKGKVQVLHSATYMSQTRDQGPNLQNFVK